MIHGTHGGRELSGSTDDGAVMMRRLAHIILIAALSYLAFVLVALDTYPVRAPLPNDGPPYAVFLGSLALFGAAASAHRPRIAIAAALLYCIIWTAACLATIGAMMSADDVSASNTMLVLGGVYIASGPPIALLATCISLAVRRHSGRVR